MAVQVLQEAVAVVALGVIEGYADNAHKKDEGRGSRRGRGRLRSL